MPEGCGGQDGSHLDCREGFHRKRPHILDLETRQDGSPYDSPEERPRKSPYRSPGTDGTDFGIYHYNTETNDLSNKMGIDPDRLRPGHSYQRIDSTMVHHHQNNQLYEHPMANLTKTQIQKNWQLPELVAPDEFHEFIPMETGEEVTPTKSDAVLYRVKEQVEDGSLKIHSILKMMSEIPDSMLSKGNTQPQDQTNSTFNLFMGDVSRSMSDVWPSVVKGWNTHIQSNLVGRTTIMTFGSDVTIKRSGNTSNCHEISQTDFDGTCTDLTGALQAIVEEVYKCKEKFINVFIVTDGIHNQTECQPDDTIEKMRAPGGKICDVYILGVGNSFPIPCSVNIRSHLHNGRANLPTIFWAKDDYINDMDQQMKDIASYLCQMGNSNIIKLSIPGKILPFSSSQNSFHLNDYVYFDKAPEEIQEIQMQLGKFNGKMALDTRNADVDHYVNNIFRQWNGILIQMHNKKETISPEIVPFMERVCNTVINERKNKKSSSIQSRLSFKKMEGYEVEFQTLMDTIKNILTNKNISNEFQLAENILLTTVTTNKYAERARRMKGHSSEEYVEDLENFRRVYRTEKSNLMNIDVTAEDCCRVTITSTISDLKDEDFNDLLDLNKYDFLKTFTMSGIPILSSLKDVVMVNPWIYSIRRILKSPHTIVSQAVLENMSTANSNSVEQNKCVKLQEDDDETCFNAIIPVFPPNVAPEMKNIMRTNIYAMCCTFSILRNPHIIDFNVHMAALGIAWVRLLYENQEQPRSEYVQYRMKCIEATAAQYSDRPSFAKYRDWLQNMPNQAIMTESTVKIDGSTLKCESLVKPMFILQLAVQDKKITDRTIIKKIVKTILIEYIGRCISCNVRRGNDSDKNTRCFSNNIRQNNDTDKNTRCFSNNVRQDNDSEKNTRCSDFFSEDLTNQDNNGEVVKKYIEETNAKLTGNAVNLLEVFYCKEQCRKEAEKAAKDVIELHAVELTNDVQVKLNERKINQLRNVSACGDVSWATLKTFAKEVGLSEYDVNDLFSDKNIVLYVDHGFKYTYSRERLAVPLSDDNKCVEEITRKLKEKRCKTLIEKLVKEMVKSWLSTYMEAHAGIVQPMTKAQIIQEANINGSTVNNENFDQVYKRYRPLVGLMGNACQSRSCPWFLQPMTQYREHAATERRSMDFPHGLHIASKLYSAEDDITIKNKIVEGERWKVIENKIVARESTKSNKATHERLADFELFHLKNSYRQMDIQ